MSDYTIAFIIGVQVAQLLIIISIAADVASIHQHLIEKL